MIEGCPNCPWREKYNELKKEVEVLKELVEHLYFDDNKMTTHGIITSRVLNKDEE